MNIKPSDDTGPIVVGAVMTAAFGMVALLSLAFFVYYVTLPPSPYPPMDTPGYGLFPLFCFGTFLVLALSAFFLGTKTFKSYQAWRVHASVSAPQAAENHSDSARASNHPES